MSGASGGGRPSERPETAEALMRSRFDAFARADPAWLLETWHPSTRPESLDLSDNPRWRRLRIVETEAGGVDDLTGVVEFRASFLADDGPGVLHERSRFVREEGRWYYLDGRLRPSL